MTAEPGHNGVAADELRQFVERTERVNADIAALNSDKRDIFAEAKGRGFDVRALKQIVAIRAMDHSVREERDAILELYKSALGLR